MRFGGDTLFKNVDLQFNPGNCYGIIGANGAGKSTLMNIIGGLDRPTAGKIFVNGTDLLKLPEKDMMKYMRETIGFVWQNTARNMIPYLNAIDNVKLVMQMAGKLDVNRANMLLELVGLEKRKKNKMHELSGGEQQRVAIARALVNEPKVLLLDEPLGALDLRLRKDMQNELKRIQQATGITFIYVTHDQEEALSMSDTVVVMDKGRIQQIGKPEDIYNEPKNAFVADFIGESNILDGVMLEDFKVRFFGRNFRCVDQGFAPNEPVDVVIRPEDIDIVAPEEGHLVGTVTSVTFKGLNYDIIVEFKGFKWLIQTTDFHGVGSTIGIRLNPEDIHIMKKSEYSGMFGDYSSYSAEYDELTEDADDEEE